MIAGIITYRKREFSLERARSSGMKWEKGKHTKNDGDINGNWNGNCYVGIGRQWGSKIHSRRPLIVNYSQVHISIKCVKR